METYHYASEDAAAFPTALEVASRYLPARTVRFADAPDERIWDTGLRCGLRILIRPDHRDQVPVGLIAFVERIKELELLSPNWDSYQAHPLDQRAEHPAVELAIASNQRSNYPSVHPLPNGGLGLRWVSETSELEIDVSPDGSCEGLLELNQGQEFELSRGSTLGQAKALLARFFKAG